MSAVTVVCTYRVRRGSEAEFEQLLARHLPTLVRLGLVTGTPTRTLRREDGDLDGGPEYVEVFDWVSEDAARRAAEVPEVIEVWEPMAALCEARDGRPAMEFPRHRSLT